jgi:hypothetical protein
MKGEAVEVLKRPKSGETLKPLETQHLFAPDLGAPVTAFRDWRIYRDELCSPVTGVLWTDRVMHATCRPQCADDLLIAPHAAPHPRCQCGIHAWFESSDEPSKVNFRAVSGIVSLWGRIEVADDLIRAESARVECLGIYSRWTQRHKDSVRAIADDFGVDLVDLYDLPAAAAIYGRPLPEALVPRTGVGRSILVEA